MPLLRFCTTKRRKTRQSAAKATTPFVNVGFDLAKAHASRRKNEGMPQVMTGSRFAAIEAALTNRSDHARGPTKNRTSRILNMRKY